MWSRRWSRCTSKKHGGDPEKSLAALSVGHSACGTLTQLGDRDVDAMVAQLKAGEVSTEVGSDADRTANCVLISVPRLCFRPRMVSAARG
jgi:hypothetical protein